MGVKVKWYGKRYTKDLYSYADKRIHKLAERVNQRAKSLCTVQTGALRQSLKVVKQNLMSYRIQSDKDYALYVEYGTSRTSPNPYFRPAINMIRGL